MTNNASVEHTIKNLEQYSDNLEDLILQLDEEHQALKDRDITTLEDSTQKKKEILQQLEAMDHENNITNRLLVDHPDNKNVLFAKDRIKGLINDCRRQNDINGAILDLSNKFNQRMLGILLGKNTDNKLYDAAGKNSSNNTTQSVARI